VQLDEITWPDQAIAPLRRLTNSGGRLPVPLVQRMRARFPKLDLYLMYGLTEAFRSTYLEPALVDLFPDAVGKAIPFAEVRIVRPDGSETAAGEPGELVHGGPLVAQGYWQDVARTAARFRPAPSCMTAPGMAVWSGDTLVRDAQGLLRFVGRDDEMIKISGNRVSPTEIEEAALASHHVAEAVAFGVADDRLGQAIWLVARPVGPQGDDVRGEAGLIAWFRREMPSHMVPQRIIWRNEFPRNPNGKLDRVQIRNEVIS
jgi:acyl-CoA synthetase (AMP-forming)/AMP-acid ligase II